MSLRADGKYRCDRSGRELVNGGVQECIIVTDLDPATDNTTTRVLHFCREDGCAGKVLSARNLADYKEVNP